MTNFDKAFDLVVGVEGGYVNDPKDPGGETKFGISKRSYPNIDIKNLSLEAAKSIYKKDFWDKVKGDELDWPVSYLVFDFAVNSGVRTAIVGLQKTLQVAVDGIFGPETVAAANKLDEEGHCTYLAQRAIYMQSLANYDRYKVGWLKRLFKIAKC